MNEEEILKHVEYSLINPCFNNGNSTIINNEDLQGLLDLYNKEKEKNQECLKYMNYWKNLYDSTFIELQQEKEKNKELIQGQVKTLDEILQPELLKKYISKDKIRELKEKTHKTLDGNGITRAYQLDIDGYFNKVLEEE